METLKFKIQGAETVTRFFSKPYKCKHPGISGVFALFYYYLRRVFPSFK